MAEKTTRNRRPVVGGRIPKRETTAALADAETSPLEASVNSEGTAPSFACLCICYHRAMVVEDLKCSRCGRRVCGECLLDGKSNDGWDNDVKLCSTCVGEGVSCRARTTAEVKPDVELPPQPEELPEDGN